MSQLLVGNLQAAAFDPIIATGGSVSNVAVGNITYRIHQFLSTGTSEFVVTDSGSFGEIEYLIVGGGGGGGMDMGGGGGAGGVVAGRRKIAPGTYTITVGAGGWGAPGGLETRGDGAGPQPGAHQFTIPATNGGNSSAFGITAYGGGAGGSSYFPYTPGAAGTAGGSGGGASAYSDNTLRLGGAPVGGQGYRGGNGGPTQYYGGGGGGASQAGADPNTTANGGAGVFNAILGTGYHWGGGGGGSGYSIAGGSGGIGGGGGGAIGTTTGGAGLNNGAAGGGGATSSQANTRGGNAGANTGGGGGGGSHYNRTNSGGNGASGITVVRYPVSGNVIYVESPSYIASAGSPIQVNVMRTDDRSAWAAPAGTAAQSYTYGTPVWPLSVSIRPKMNSSLLRVSWTINGEIHHDTKWTIWMNDSLCRVPGYEGWNAEATPAYWVGYVPGIYEAAADVNSTLNHWKVEFFIKTNSTDMVTFTPAISSASTTAYTFFLNRTAGALGQDSYENAVSTASIWEIAQ